jgi:glucoamylase
VWAHAEYLKLCRSLRDGEPFDRPPQTVARYLTNHTASTLVVWRANNKIRAMPSGMTLRIEAPEPALVHWGTNGWQAIRDASTRDTTLGVHVVDLQTASLTAGSHVDFTLYWPAEGRWEGAVYRVDFT